MILLLIEVDEFRGIDQFYEIKTRYSAENVIIKSWPS